MSIILGPVMPRVLPYVPPTASIWFPKKLQLKSVSKMVRSAAALWPSSYGLPTLRLQKCKLCSQERLAKSKTKTLLSSVTFNSLPTANDPKIWVFVTCHLFFFYRSLSIRVRKSSDHFGAFKSQGFKEEDVFCFTHCFTEIVLCNKHRY